MTVRPEHHNVKAAAAAAPAAQNDRGGVTFLVMAAVNVTVWSIIFTVNVTVTMI